MDHYEYTIRQYDHGGIAIFGSVPVDEFCRLCRRWEKLGMVFCPEAQDALGATCAVATAGVAKKWAEQIKADARGDWLMAGDTGDSSRTIYAVLADAPHVIRGGPSVPHDADDFGRCVRCLEWHPGWRERLGEVAAKYPEWVPLIREWPVLMGLYRPLVDEVLAKGWADAKEMNERIRVLVEEGRKAKAAAGEDGAKC